MSRLKNFLSPIFVVLCLAIPAWAQLGVVSSGHIDVIDLERREVKRTITDPNIDARGVKITPDNSLAIVASLRKIGRYLLFIDLEAETPEIIDRLDLAEFGPFNASDIAITPDSRFALTQGGFLASVDIAARKVIDGLPYHAMFVVITPDGRFAIMWGRVDPEGRTEGMAVFYIAEDGRLWDTGQRINPGIDVGNLAITPNGRLVLATGGLRGFYPYVHVFRVSDGVIEYVNSIGIVGQSRGLGIAVTPDGRKVYLTDYFQSNIRVLAIDEAGNVRDTLRTIGVPRGTPSGLNRIYGIAMAARENGSFAYLCSTNSGVVSIVDVETDTVLPEVIRLTLRPDQGLAVQQ